MFKADLNLETVAVATRHRVSQRSIESSGQRQAYVSTLRMLDVPRGIAGYGCDAAVTYALLTLLPLQVDEAAKNVVAYKGLTIYAEI